MITQARLKELLRYDPETGQFTWRVTRTGPKPIDGAAGCISKAHGYRTITINNRSYRASRLAWLYMIGELPTHQVDHINMDRSDDRWCNLREASSTQNFGNQRRYRNNRSGLKGVCWHERDQHWRAQGQFNNRKVMIGSFNCPAAAHLAYVVWADKHFGEFARAQ